MRVRLTSSIQDDAGQALQGDLARVPDLVVERRSTTGAADPGLVDLVLTVAGLPILNRLLKILDTHLQMRTVREITLQREGTNAKVTLTAKGLSPDDLDVLRKWIDSGRSDSPDRRNPES
jgi:hypothetical protein